MSNCLAMGGELASGSTVDRSETGESRSYRDRIEIYCIIVRCAWAPRVFRLVVRVDGYKYPSSEAKLAGETK